MHAGWNTFGKNRGLTTPFFLLTTLSGAVAFSPVLLIYPSVVASMTRTDGMLVVMAGLFEAIYMGCLVGGYRSGELSVVYPVARAVPALLVAAVSIFAGWAGDTITPLYWYGALLIVIGSLFIPLSAFHDFRWRTYAHSGFLFALAAAAGTTGYALVDDAALHRLRLANPGVPKAVVTVTYACLQAATTTCWLALVVASQRRTREDLWHIVRKSLGVTVFTGAWITATYAFVLLAMAYAANVSYVVAFRQISIPIAVCSGIVLLRESTSTAKLVGVTALTLGIVLVALA